MEWTLGLVIPLLVAGPICATFTAVATRHKLMISTDYVNQDARFEVVEGFGCSNASSGSILKILIIDTWSFIPPLLSIIIYCRASHISLCDPHLQLTSNMQPGCSSFSIARTETSIVSCAATTQFRARTTCASSSLPQLTSSLHCPSAS